MGKGFKDRGKEKLFPAGKKDMMSIESLMDDSEDDPTSKKTNKEVRKSVITDSHKPVNVIQEEQEPTPKKEKMIRHDFQFSESLTEVLEDFMFHAKPRIKNKHDVMRALLWDFLSLPEEKRQKRYETMTKKHLGKK